MHYLTLNVAQYHLHHITHAHAKFKVSMSNGLGEDAFTRNTLFDLDHDKPKYVHKVLVNRLVKRVLEKVRLGELTVLIAVN